MASLSVTDRHIEIGLESLRLMISDLPELAAEWDHLDDGERATWSHDWDQVIGTDLRLLHPYYRAGAMTPEQEARFRDILSQLRETLPIIERLALSPPPIPLEP
jgi:hypothetical protein